MSSELKQQVCLLEQRRQEQGRAQRAKKRGRHRDVALQHEILKQRKMTLREHLKDDPPRAPSESTCVKTMSTQGLLPACWAREAHRRRA